MKEVLNQLQDAEEKAFYAYTRETDATRKAEYKAIDSLIRVAIQELARVLEADNDCSGYGV